MVGGATLLAVVLGILAVQRLLEIAFNRRNVARLVARGGRVVQDDGYLGLVLVHAAVFVAFPAEWALAPWAGLHAATWALLGVFVATDALRLWSTFTLGARWTTKVVVVAGEAPVLRGPYRFLRHPIYDALRVELFALPLAFGLFGCALVLGAANLLAVQNRIRKEDAAWREGKPVHQNH